MKSPTGLRIPVVETNADVKVGTIRSMIRLAGIPREVWNSL